jgi:hypothetical protein
MVWRLKVPVPSLHIKTLAQRPRQLGGGGRRSGDDRAMAVPKVNAAARRYGPLGSPAGPVPSRMGRARWQQVTAQTRSSSTSDLLGDTRRLLRERFKRDDK